MKLVKRPERLYSVLLTEDELRLFSEVQRMYAEEEQKKESHTLRNLAIGAAATAGTVWAGRRGYLGTGIQRNLGKAEARVGKWTGSNTLIKSGSRVQADATRTQFLKNNNITDASKMTTAQTKAMGKEMNATYQDSMTRNNFQKRQLTEDMQKKIQEQQAAKAAAAKKQAAQNNKKRNKKQNTQQTAAQTQQPTQTQQQAPTTQYPALGNPSVPNPQVNTSGGYYY